MKFAYKFSNLIGTVYRKGNVCFTPDGNTVIVPVGNRLSFFDMRNNKSCTLPIENRFNFIAVDISKSGLLALVIDENNEAHLCSLTSRSVIHRYKFRETVTCVRFSPDDRYFAIASGNSLMIYRTPGHKTREYNPFVLERMFTCGSDYCTYVQWSSDSRLLCVGTKDMNTIVLPLFNVKSLFRAVLGGHRDQIVACFFEKDSLDIYSICRDGRLCVWECSDELEDLKPAAKHEDIDSTTKYALEAKHYLRDDLKTQDYVQLLSADYHNVTHMLVTGYSNGAFLLHELPARTLIHSLTLSDHSIDAVSFNPTGEWIALCSMALGELVVWEWQSESFVLKQQGHANNIGCVAYSPDGAWLVTGGNDGKVKLWNTMTGFCFVTFTDHTSIVSAVTFTQSGKCVISASHDGTVRATDTKRYRNFRTLTPPHTAQFLSLAVDPSGEIVCAGSQDTFEIFVWSMQTGRLVEILSGHTAPVGGVSFSSSQPLIVSVCWDKICRVWSVFSSKGIRESVQLTSDGIAVEFAPNGMEFAVATLDGNITVFNATTSDQLACIEGKHDLWRGKRDTDLITAKSLNKSQAFTTLTYTADGECILAAGRSKFICIYHVREAILLKKFEITQNRSLDGIDDFCHSRRNLTEFGNLALIEERDDFIARGKQEVVSLPGTKKGDLSSRKAKPEVMVSCVRFSPTGRAFVATTTEGVLVYSLDQNIVFDPFDFGEEVTPDAVKSHRERGEFARALIMALRLNEPVPLRESLEAVPVSNIKTIVEGLPQLYVEKLLKYLAGQLEETNLIEFYVIWIHEIIVKYGETLKNRSGDIMAVLRTLQKNLTQRLRDIGKICEHNRYSMEYLLTVAEADEERQNRKSELRPEVTSQEVESGGDDSDSDMFIIRAH